MFITDRAETNSPVRPFWQRALRFSAAQRHVFSPTSTDGSEGLAVEALRKGAANYIPKRLLEHDLIPTINSIVEMIDSRRTRSSVLSALTHAESTYRFGNDREFASSLISQFEAELHQLVYDDGTGAFRIITALKEAILNAIDHGNLELDSSLRDDGEGIEYRRLGDERKQQEPYRQRKVTVTSRVSPEQLAYVIRDEGPGFDPTKLPDPTDPENILRAHGRGLMLIRSFMDDVVFNKTGNQITLIKYRDNQDVDTSDESPAPLPNKNLQILLAEDSPTSQVLATSLLERAGHTVTIVGDGVEAVDIWADGNFDLILMDLEMPKQGGLEATREIRSREAGTTNPIPIIAMTAHDAEDDLEHCNDAGMQGHLAKPVTAEKLNGVLTSF